jgi:AGCS family alanine or glycine:cation symporter
VTIFSCGLLLPGVQQTRLASLDIAFGLSPNVTAALLAVLLSFIIFGGVKRIASFSSMVVPFMALGYYCRLRDYRY